MLMTANVSTVEDEELSRRAKLCVYQLINILNLTYANKLWVRLEIQGGKLKFLRRFLRKSVIPVELPLLQGPAEGHLLMIIRDSSRFLHQYQWVSKYSSF